MQPDHSKRGYVFAVVYSVVSLSLSVSTSEIICEFSVDFWKRSALVPKKQAVGYLR